MFTRFIRCLVWGVGVGVLAYPPSLRSAEPPPAEKNVRIAPDSRNQIVTLTDQGLDPLTLRTNKSDSIIFFLNSTTDSLTTIEIDYGEKRMHCASGSLKLDNDGKIRSTRPFGPRTFTSACFPDRGTYTVTVHGLPPPRTAASGTIIVE
jgi:hypothetical protein